MARDRNHIDNLRTLKDMDDFEVEDGEPDPRGWEVMSADGRRLGKVDDMLVDEAAMKVRYLEVDVDEKGLGFDEDDRHLLVPVSYARLDESRRNVLVDRLEAARVKDMRGRYDLATADLPEADTRHASARRDTEVERGEARVTRSEEELAIGKREHKAGSVEVDKHVETEHVSKPVTLKHEEVEVERRPATGMSARGRAEIGEEEIRVPITEEEAVVSKRPVVREEIVLRKREVEDTERVEADLRKERVDIEKHGNVERGRR